MGQVIVLLTDGYADWETAEVFRAGGVGETDISRFLSMVAAEHAQTG